MKGQYFKNQRNKKLFSLFLKLKFILVFIYAFIVNIYAQPDSIDESLQHEMGIRKIPGLAFAVIDHGKIITERAYGLENLETGTALTTNGVFELASVTKPFTAAAIMILVEEGKIALDDSINKYLQNAPSTWNKITIRQLLSHTSGLRGGGWIECNGSPLLQITKKQQFDDIARSNLNYVPGDSAEYSDPGYFLLGMIIENVSGLSYSQFMKQRIFLPNGMTSTIIEDRRKIIKNHVSEYTLHDGQLEQERRVWQNDLPSFYGVWSTIDDLAKWITALENCQVVTKETLLQMWNVTKLKNGNLAIVDGMPYGLGWFTIDLGGQKIVGHPGFLGSAVFHYVDQQFTVILLTNLDVSAGSFQVPLIQKIVVHFRPDLPHSLN